MCHPMHHEKTCSATCSGVVDDWKSYSTNGNGVTTIGKNSFTSSINPDFTLVNIEYCNLKKVTKVNTWLTCTGYCWAASGAESVYSLTLKSFKTYLYQIANVVNEARAKEWNYALHYEVTGIC